MANPTENSVSRAQVDVIALSFVRLDSSSTESRLRLLTRRFVFTHVRTIRMRSDAIFDDGDRGFLAAHNSKRLRSAQCRGDDPPCGSVGEARKRGRRVR